MSWIIGILSYRLLPQEVKRLQAVHHSPLHRHAIKKMYIAAGGIEQTCHYGLFPDSDNRGFTGWMTAGTAFQRIAGRRVFMTPGSWQALLACRRPDFSAVNGHFVCARWTDDRIEFFTDELGLRTLYIAHAAGKICFSTRLDWLAQATNIHEIDFRAFGSHWLTFHQLSCKSLIKGFHRLGQKGYAVCTPDSVTVKSALWTPETARVNEKSCSGVLRPFLQTRLDGSRRLALALSGGCDSRTLLALLTAEKADPFAVFTFGDEEDPDVKIAGRIAGSLGLRWIYRNEPMPSADECLQLLREYAGNVCAISPASSVLFLRYYPCLHADKYVLIDGGFGDLARRMLFNRILYNGKKSLLRKQPALIYKYLTVHRASLFNADALHRMEEGIISDVEELTAAAPEIAECGVENFLDLLAVRTRLPHYYAHEQARLDGMVRNFMPFAQPDFLHYLFTVPARSRRNGRLFKKIINDHNPLLKRFPLVKSNTTYPFRCTVLQSWVWIKVKNRIVPGFKNPAQVDFLLKMRDFVRDTVHSQEVKSYAAFDYSAILEMVEDFYNGNTHRANEVDWWLAFYIWWSQCMKSP